MPNYFIRLNIYNFKPILEKYGVFPMARPAVVARWRGFSNSFAFIDVHLFMPVACRESL